MFCHHCGQRNIDEARFCIGCGKKLLQAQGSSAVVDELDRGDTVGLPNTPSPSLNPTPPGSVADLDRPGGTISVGVLSPGQVLAGRYRIEQKLGSGGMGEVWKAFDQELALAVALKVLPPILSGNSRAVAALKHEAALSLRLTHPHICRIHTFHSDGRLGFLVMELIDGATLEQILDSRPNRKMGLEEVLPLFRAIAAALDHAHRQQPPILHRDIKPANIMVNSAGEPKLMDFGIAREIKDSLTRVTSHEVVGTLLYMAREQFLGQKLTPAADQYSLAASLYECLAGRPPFDSGHIGHQLLNMQPPSLSEQGADVPRPIDAAILRALAKKPEERFASVQAFVEELREQWQKAHSPKSERNPGEIVTNSLGMEFAWIPVELERKSRERQEAERQPKQQEKAREKAELERKRREQEEANDLMAAIFPPPPADRERQEL